MIEKNSRLLKFLDEHVSNAVEKRLKEIGVEIILNATIEHISKGEVEMELRHGNVKRKINAHVVVVCTGRKPTINYENFNKLGIEFNEDRSTIMIDEKTCCTSIKNIYACGGVVSSCWSWVKQKKKRTNFRADLIFYFFYLLDSVRHTPRTSCS